VAAVEVAVDVETIKISTVIIDTNMSSAITMDMVAMTATIMITAMVAVVDIVGVVAIRQWRPKPSRKSP
jgi:hypothetical protein